MKKELHITRDFSILFILVLFVTTGCKKNPSGPEPLDPDSAPDAIIDRFSDDAGMLFRRSGNPDLPDPNEPIDFDQIPFITTGLGPDGEITQYYNFDVMPTQPAPIFVLFREGESMPVEGQLNIVNVIPGDPGYNDFWHVHRVIVPEDYVANTVTSLADINEEGYAIEDTETLVNCPIVPEGSTADLRYNDSESTDLVRGWYRDMVVYYFNFLEKDLTRDGSGQIPTSPIYVSFNTNPGEPGGGPPSGFKTETGSDQTHNVPATLPEDANYSPLWFVIIYDNADFDQVSDLPSAMSADILAQGAAIVNCPIVSVTE